MGKERVQPPSFKSCCDKGSWEFLDCLFGQQRIPRIVLRGYLNSILMEALLAVLDI